MPGARGAGTSPAPAKGRARPVAAPNGAAETAERLKQIIGDAATPEDALEPSLRWIVEASGGAGGAICFFDQRKELLRLAAECNLSDEGCRRLRSVRRGDVAGWDMPLHGLHNRRAYLIDSAANNRYVPPLIDPPALVRSIVCLPLYQGNTALGSLLIIATGVRVLMERDIRSLEPSLRELVTLIEAIRLRAPVLAPSARTEVVTPPAAGPTPAPDVARIRRGAESDDDGSPSAVLMEVIELRSAVHEERARAAELEAKLQEATAALETALTRERALKQQLAAARPAVREDLPSRLAEIEARAEAQADRAAELEARLAAAEASAASERARAEEEATRKVAEATAGIRESGAAELAATRAAASLEHDLCATRERETALRASLAALEAEVAKLRAAEPASPPPSPGAPASPAPSAVASGTLVIDTGGAWVRLGRGAPVQVVAPDEHLGQRLHATTGRVLVNLAAPGALHALARVRAAGSVRRFWGCLATPDAARALPLGMIEPAVRPLAPEALVELLVGYASRGTRVVTLGRDVDAFGGFRQSMALQGLSVSMAWDAKQAADVIAMVRPEVAVVDLESLREGCAIIAGLAGAEPLPHLILLLGAKDPTPGFAHAVRDPAHASRALPLDRLVAEVGRRSEARPAERR